MSHLDSIVTRERKSVVRDFLFAALLAIAAVVSVTSVGSVCSAATVHVAAR